MIPIEDRGFTLGDGVFETVLADAGRLVALDRHMARMAAGATALGLLRPDPEQIGAAARKALADSGLAGTRAAVRLSWTAGSGGRGLDRPDVLEPRLWVACAAAPRPTTPARLHLSSVRRNEGSLASRHKTLAYLDNVLARREARAAGADEAVMLNNAGRLACAAAANLFWVKEGRLHTPSLACGVLAGLVREQVIAAADAAGIEVVEESAGPEALTSGDAVFLTNSLIGVRPAAAPTTDDGARIVRMLARTM